MSNPTGKEELESFREENQQLKQQVHELLAIKQDFETALSCSPLAVCHHDLELRYTWIYRPHMGFNPAEVIGKTDFELLDYDLASRMAVIKRRVLETGVGEQHVIPTHEPAQEDTEFFDLRTEPRRDEAGNIIGLLCTGVDVTELTRANEQLQQITASLEQTNRNLETLSLTDPLTGIANRRQFDLMLEDALQQCMAQGEPLAVMLLDVDLFKSYNDQFGHPAGDEVLQQVAQTLQHCVRRGTDLVARYGGEEFVLVLPGCGAQRCRQLAEQISLDVLSLDISHPHSPADRITVSLGVAVQMHVDEDSAAALLSAADQAMYQAKKAGRNCSQFACL